ncbi:MAG: hypothetical protein AB7K04_06305, partial [Pseudorhodoplanes sp.]
MALPCLAGLGCSSPSSLFESVSSTSTKPSSFFQSPDWMRDPGAKDIVLSRPISPEDLAGADGSCAGAAPASEGEGGSQPALVVGGIGLGMSECQVIRRAGQADNVAL